MIFATNNQNKLKELKKIFNNKEILCLNDLNINIDIEETGKTFYENALIKAKTIYNITKIPTIADDSGLCVDSLNGEPGIYSARYAGENATQEESMEATQTEEVGKSDGENEPQVTTSGQ